MCPILKFNHSINETGKKQLNPPFVKKHNTRLCENHPILAHSLDYL